MLVLAELPLTVQSVSVVVPSLYRPPPYAGTAAGDRQSRDRRRDIRSTWNTRLSPPPLTVTPAAGPVIVSVPVVLLSSSWRAGQVIVWAAAKTVGSKVIVLARNGVGAGDRLAKAGRAVAGIGVVGGGVDHEAGTMTTWNSIGADVDRAVEEAGLRRAGRW